MSYKKKHLGIQGDYTATFRSKLILGERIEKERNLFPPKSDHINSEFLFVRSFLGNSAWATVLVWCLWCR